MPSRYLLCLILSQSLDDGINPSHETQKENSLRSYSKVLIFVSALLLFSTVAFGQGDQGRIAGVVKDASGAVIPGVSITVTNDRTGEERTAITGDVGDFLIPALKPSVYTVKAELTGFSPTQVKEVHLVVGQKVNLDLTIQPAGISESVTVETLSEATVDTSSASMSANVDVREVGAFRSMAVSSHSCTFRRRELRTPAPEHSATSGSMAARSNRTPSAMTALKVLESWMQRPALLAANWSLPFRLQSSLENVQEFRVESNNYPAEYGTGTGGQVSVVTKSGRNAVPRLAVRISPQRQVRCAELFR